MCSISFIEVLHERVLEVRGIRSVVQPHDRTVDQIRVLRDAAGCREVVLVKVDDNLREAMLVLFKPLRLLLVSMV